MPNDRVLFDQPSTISHQPDPSLSQRSCGGYKSVCHVSGLSIITRPEWTEIKLDSDYYATYSVIGKAILLITLKGNPSEKGSISLLEKREEVIHQWFSKKAGLSDRKYVELRDYRMLTGTSSKGGRMVLTNFLLKEQSKGYLQGFWVFGAHLLIRFMFQAGLRLHKTVIPIGVAKDYRDAVRNALKVLRQGGIDVGSILYPRLKKDGWALDIEEYGISFELIGDDILYTIARGKQRESHVDKYFELHEKVLHETGLSEKGYYYRIINWERFESIPWRARLKYLHGLKELNKKTPCRLSVIFGLNNFMKALVAINRPFVSIPVMVAKDLQDALEITERERIQETGLDSGGKSQKSEVKTYTEEQLKGFANEMLQVIGGINWDQAGISLNGMNEEHPLKPVLDALAVIKLDLDNLIQEKESSKKDIQESEEKYRLLAENASDTIWMLNMDGAFTYHSPSIRKLRGYSPDEANRIALEQTITPVSMPLLLHIAEEENTKPLADQWADRIVELEMYRKDGGTLWTESLVRAVRDTDGNVTGLQGSTRDITDRKKVEDALNKSEAQYRLLADNAQDQIWLMDLNLKPTYISPSVEKIRGYTFEEIVQLPLDKQLTATSFQSAMEFFSSEMPKAQADPTYFARPLELEFYSKDGSTLWSENTFSQIRDENGKQLSLLGVGRDITVRKQAEEALRQSEEKYRWVMNNMADIISVLDMNLQFTYVSPSVMRVRGYTAEEAVEQTLDQTLTPESLTIAAKFFEEEMKLEASGTADPFRNRILEVAQYHKDGSIIWLENSLSFIRDAAQKAVGISSVSRNITERKRVEENLRKSEEKYRNILESIEDAYFEVDLTGNLTFFNRSICNILDYPREELLGLNNRAYMDPENAKKVFQAFNEILVTRVPSKGFEWEVIQKGGARKHVEVSVSLIVSPEGMPTGFRGIARDVSERKKIELELKNHRERLEEMITERTSELAAAMRKSECANKAKSQFLANMSHEIRTPLNGIVGMAEICLKTELDMDQKLIVGTITKEANSLLGIVNEILDFSKIEAGKLEVEQIPFDLRNLFEDLTESFSYRTVNKRLELTFFISPETPIRLVGDPGRLRQILKNLIGNAFKFTHEGGIYVKAEPTQDVGDKIKLRFLVKDTGIGISKEKQAIVFESFTQADGSTTRKYGGTGLGTTISKQLAELMGGEIGVDSEEGKGSTFWFTVVFSKQSETVFHKSKELPLGNVRVLVVDDIKTSRQTIVEYVNSWGLIPVEATSAKEALSILNGNIASGEQVNLVLSDLNMPDINGFDLAREIRSVESFNSVPIIVITACGNAGDGKTCRDIGIEGYLTKPIQGKYLRGTIERVLVSSMSGENGGKIDLVTRHSIAEEARRRRVLLAEDYPTNQMVAKRHLEYAGYQVDLAEDGKQAIDAFKCNHYELIFMDVQMPVMDGYQATKFIRDFESELAAMENGNVRETMHRVPIIAMTAHALSECKQLCLEAGMDDFLSKPFTRSELLLMASKWLKATAVDGSTIDGKRLTVNGKR
jgi:PAS domain S-box-containing protein